MLKLQQTQLILPELSLDERSSMESMVNTVSNAFVSPNFHFQPSLQLLHYLRPSWAAYHMRVVTLIWSVERISTSPHIESIISQQLASQNSQRVQEACEAFGVLWRLTGMQNHSSDICV